MTLAACGGLIGHRDVGDAPPNPTPDAATTIPDVAVAAPDTGHVVDDVGVLADDGTADVADGCGSTHKDCLGGACVNGQCQPVTLATGPAFTTLCHLALDAASVYCAGYDSGTISKVGKSGGALVVLATKQNFPEAIAVRAGEVYWTELQSNDLGHTGATGGAVEHFRQLSNTHAFVFVGSTIYASSSTGILTVPLDGAQTTVWFPDAAGAQDITTDGANVFWLEFGPGKVMQRALAGGDAITVAKGALGPTEVRTYGGDVYWNEGWLDTFHGAIHAAPFGGGTVRDIATGDVFPNAFAIDATGVYWTNPIAHEVLRRAHGSTTTEVLARDQIGAFDIALDDRAVYWSAYVDDKDGAIRKLAK
jgi:hypothetical protein